MVIEGKNGLGFPDWPPNPVEKKSKAPDWKSSPMGIEGKEKVGDPDCPPTPVGTISQTP